MAVQAKQARCTNSTLQEPTQEENETEEVPQNVNYPSLAQQQSGETLLGLVNRKLCASMQMFPRASWLDKG